jgi:hypothetical protein
MTLTTMSWASRIIDALGVEAIDLFELPQMNTINCVKLLKSNVTVWARPVFYELNLNLNP